MKGLTLHPWLQGFASSDPIVYPLIEEAVRLNIPVIFHDGTPPYSTPLQTCHLARLYPEARIILGHSGLMDMWRNVLKGAEVNRNVYLCTTRLPLSALQTMVKALGTDRLVFGTNLAESDFDTLRTRLGLIYHLKVTK